MILIFCDSTVCSNRCMLLVSFSPALFPIAIFSSSLANLSSSSLRAASNDILVLLFFPFLHPWSIIVARTASYYLILSLRPLEVDHVRSKLLSLSIMSSFVPEVGSFFFLHFFLSSSLLKFSVLGFCGIAICTLSNTDSLLENTKTIKQNICNQS